MDDDSRELAHRLFAAATAMLEDTIEVAVAAQSPHLTAAQLARQAGRLEAAGRDIAILAEAAGTVAGSGEGELENGPETSC